MNTNKTRDPGIYLNIPNGEYHAGPELSNSGIHDILQSPYHYWARHLNPERPPKKEKAGQLEGNLAHCAILEPGEFEARYRVGPDVSRATKQWKTEEESAKADGVTLIKSDQATVAMAQSRAVRSIPEVEELLSSGNPEVSAFWRDPEFQVMCRCRPDWVHPVGEEGVILMDVKTFSDSDPEEFARQASRKFYDQQHAFYVDGYSIASGKKVLGFIFVAVETDYPYAASAVMLDDDSVEAGRDRYREGVRRFAECAETREWPGYGANGIELIRLAGWRLGR